MSQQNEGTWRARLVAILGLLYALALLALAGAVRGEADLAQRVWLTESAVATQAHSAAAAASNIGLDAAAARERLNALEALLPQDVGPDLLQPVVRAADKARLSGLHLEASGPLRLTGKSNALITHSYILTGSGSQAAIKGFLDDVHRDSSPAVLVDSIALMPVGGEWAMTAGIVVYTWGGEE